ncbi:hypothetical protein D3C83_146860 [compost metagenome]
MFAGQPFGHFDVVEVSADRRVVSQLEIGAGSSGEAETRVTQQVAEQVTLALIEARQLGDVFGILGHEVG